MKRHLAAKKKVMKHGLRGNMQNARQRNAQLNALSWQLFLGMRTLARHRAVNVMCTTCCRQGGESLAGEPLYIVQLREDGEEGQKGMEGWRVGGRIFGEGSSSADFPSSPAC